MNSSRLLGGASALAAIALLGACTGSPSAAPDTGKTQVVAAIYPYEWLAEQIGGDRVTVEGLLPPGGEAHDLELTPQQVADVTIKGDLILYESHFQAAVDSAVGQGVHGTALDVRTLVQNLDTTESPDGHDTETPTDAHDAAADPHLWLDPTALVTVADAVRDKLTAIDPAGADTYRANTDTVTAALTAVDAEYKAGLASCDRTGFVTSHEAFGYLAQRYGLQQISIRGLDATVEPTAARIAEVQDMAKREGITTIFYETAVSPAVSQAIARDAGLRTDVLDPIEARPTDTARGADYLGVMRANLQSLRTANGCR
ncbi:metal ABC transporter substrate-binding protein [Raineyella sp. LH-20]|uniref:metal ABC transporter substrate-binding protein n=1 Tax=Raineyella sp. LH-20 TaxID=3081204 RepID=UPI0029530BB7|nr:metal ABC transporter substrate-binding protein [Raineyella sp. LH-20]WOP17804.1 metal ABC transporter substrate-binding protein [Raineyella sp. LH-20]